ncbi:hypothetical protein VPH35_117362 [Triticum aestivum]
MLIQKGKKITTASKRSEPSNIHPLHSEIFLSASPIPSSPAQPPCSPALTYPNPNQSGSKISPTVQQHRRDLELPPSRSSASPPTPQSLPPTPPEPSRVAAIAVPFLPPPRSQSRTFVSKPQAHPALNLLRYKVFET